MPLPLLLRCLGWFRIILEFFILRFSATKSPTGQRVVERIDPENNDDDHDDALLLCSATQLARMIRDGDVSCQKVVATFIRRVQKVNGQLNAMVLDTFDSAMEDARKVDGQLADGSAPSEQQCPLFGVPLTCKECFEVTGLPNTSGLIHRQSIVAQEDSPVLRRMRAAGAILLGVSNVSEVCLWFECHNRLYGVSKNPYNVQCTPGGSSGGEAALVGAGASVLGIGSDVGGSIRMPAFFCGVFGHRPSAGLVPNGGQFPISTSASSRKMLSTGPICRYAEDLELMLKIMAMGPDDVQVLKDVGVSGFDKEDTYIPNSDMPSLSVSTDSASDSNARVGISLQRGAAKLLGDSELASSHSDWPLMHAAAVASLCNSSLPPVDLSRLKYTSIVDVVTGHSVLQSPLDEELRHAQLRVASTLSQRHGITVTEKTFPQLKTASDVWSMAMADLNGPKMSEFLFNLAPGTGSAWNSTKELLKWFVGMSDHTFIALVTALLENQFKSLPEMKQNRLRQIRVTLEREMEEMIGENGVLLFPSHPTLAPLHNRPIVTPMNYAHTAVFNMFGMPVTQCPLGLSSKGLPLGVQIVSLQGNDRLTLAVARDIQEAFGGWCPPST